MTEEPVFRVEAKRGGEGNVAIYMYSERGRSHDYLYFNASPRIAKRLAEKIVAAAEWAGGESETKDFIA